MLIAIIILAILLAICLLVIVAYRQELSRWASFLEHHPQESNTRLAKAAPLPGCERVIRSINKKLDETADREGQKRLEEDKLLQGLAGLSHDIRTPLAGAKGYVQLASAEADDFERCRCLKLTEERLDTMQILLDQLFDYMRLSSSVDPSGMDEQDVMPILASVLVGNHSLFDERGWACDIDIQDASIVACVDADAMRRIFENIISNMLKHGTGDVRIIAEENSITFANRFEPDESFDIDQVFERFYRGSSSRTQASAGLGLAIVQQGCCDMGISVSASATDDSFVLLLQFDSYTQSAN